MFTAYDFNQCKGMMILEKKALYKAVYVRCLSKETVSCKVVVRMTYAKYSSSKHSAYTTLDTGG